MAIQQTADQAQLAQAAYATLAGGMPDAALRTSLQSADGKFTFTQADAFATKYSVVLQYNDTLAEGGMDSGLSVTVFQWP